ncbi:MAG: trypsin-like peptidase domain-containing protein [Lachnospiraceae bacterium]|nr:trypsin-like peptidase domain-containing protein [Lachnospiraceae bacterium]
MSDLFEEKEPEMTGGNEPMHEEAAAESSQEVNRQETKESYTYSWVSPKLQEQKAEEEEQSAANPWGSKGANTWRTETRSADGKPEENPKPAYRVVTEKTDKKKKKKPAGPGKKWATTVAMAVVFGLVSGLVFTGVTAAGRYFTEPKESEKIQFAAPEHEMQDASEVMELPAENPSVKSGGTVADVAAQCMPSLVTISTISVEEMRSFFGQTQQYEVAGAGTGVIVGQNDTELLIATNNHVVSGAKSLSVGFIDETAVEGAVKGYDASTDLAVVAVELESISSDTMDQIRVCEMGNSDELVLGEQVVAIGNALGIGQSVTSGYISAFNRELDLSDGSYTFTSSNLIQTDASINSGNSGGALLNMRGQLIGINEAKRSGNSSSASVDNIGFAIPISKAEPILESLMTLTTRDKVDEEHRSYIGITCADVNQEAASMYNIPTGVCLTSIMEGSPADQAGLKKGDILTSFDGRQVATYDELINLLQYYSAGETVEVVVQRSDEGEYSERTISLTLGSADDMPQEYQSGESQGRRGTRP